MIKELKDWLTQRSIQFEIKSNILEIAEFGKLLIVESKDGRIIDDNFSFVLSDDEYNLLDDNEDLKYIVFYWGSKFYYSELKVKKNDVGEDVFEPSFNNLINIGSYKSEFEDLKFVNLGVHTGYELLNGSGEASDWVKKAAYYKHDAMGICEKNTLAGTLPLQLACKKKSIKLILGETISVAHNFKEADDNHELFELKLYAKNYKGWRNLLNISKFINVDYDGFIPEKDLLKLGEGIIAVFPTDGYFNFVSNSTSKVLRYIKDYEKCFDDIYYQIDVTEFTSDDFDLRNLQNIKKYFDKFHKFLKPVVISDSYYINEEDCEVKSILNKIDGKAQPHSKEQHYKDVDEIIDKFSIHFENNSKSFSKFIKAIKNTRKIADECNYSIDTGNHKLPVFEVDNPEELYDDLILKGFKKKVIDKGIKDVERYLDRVNEENDVIKGAGFIHYFLILWDIIDWCKKENILVGPGRGSAAGSLVAYLLGITEVDPIEYNLLFERFLNKTRVTPEIKKEIILEDGRKFIIPIEKYNLQLKENQDIDEDFIKNNLCLYQV